MTKNSPSRSSMSIALSVRDPSTLPELTKEVQRLLEQRADSVRISLRGSHSALVSVLQSAALGGEGVSAILTLHGKTPIQPG